MTAARNFFLTSLCMSLSACGTYVPDTQDFPGDKGDQHLLVQSIVKSIHCEVGNAIIDLYADALRYPDMRSFTDNIQNWGMQLTLSLKTEEKGSLNPSFSALPASPATAILSLAGGASASSGATRTDKLYYYYKVSDLRKRSRCQTGVQPAAPVSSPLIQSDLKFKHWLYDQLAIVATGEVSVPTSNTGPLKENVLFYQVTFEVDTSLTFSPAWKLVRWNVNPTGNLASISRNRTHDLQITMGPGDSNGLKGQAANAQLSGDIGQSVASGVRESLRQ